MMNKKQITIPYTPSYHWKRTIHKELETHRFSVLVAHRRFGKTVGVINHTIKKAIQNNTRAPVYAYIAPYRNQAKKIAWSYLRYYTSVIPGIKVNESELYIELPTKHQGADGARIYVMGADNPDAIRGMYFDGVILDEPAQMKPGFYEEIIRPAIADRQGWVIWIGTPKGQNEFYERWQYAQKDPEWFAGMYRADESGIFDEGGRCGPKELEAMKKEMSEMTFRQEMLCDFTASAANVLIPIDVVTEAAKRNYRPEELAGAPKILGVDVARFGDDRSIIQKRQGLVAYEPIIFEDIDNMSLAAQIIKTINEWNPDAVFIDLGRGEGVIDRCHQLGYDVTGINFGGKATNHGRYKNKRIEMWDTMKQWLENGGAIPDNSALKTELSIPEYSFDAANRMKLESKEDIKEKMGKSPDTADALALTFAFPVKPRETWTKRNARTVNTDYNPFS